MELEVVIVDTIERLDRLLLHIHSTESLKHIILMFDHVDDDYLTQAHELMIEIHTFSEIELLGKTHCHPVVVNN